MAWHQQVGLPHQSSHRALTEWSQYHSLGWEEIEPCLCWIMRQSIICTSLFWHPSESGCHDFKCDQFIHWLAISVNGQHLYNTYSRVWVYLLLSIFDFLLSLNDFGKLQQLQDPAHSPGTELVLESTTPMTPLRKPTLNILALPKARSRTKTTFETLLLTSCPQKPHMFPSPNSSARLLHARETVKVPGNEWYFLEAEASV